MTPRRAELTVNEHRFEVGCLVTHYTPELLQATELPKDAFRHWARESPGFPRGEAGSAVVGIPA